MPELVIHAMLKRGVRPCPATNSHDPLTEPDEISVEFAKGWKDFFGLERNYDFDGDHHKTTWKSLRLVVHRDKLADHQTRFPVVTESSWIERDGHLYLEIPIDSDLPLDFLKSLIDDAYAIVWKKLDARGLRLVELSEQPYNEPALIDALIDLYGLSQHRREIQQLARPAILLQTKKSVEEELPLGFSKMGGHPDMPKDMPWPIYRDGTPLGFLGQLNLKDVARLPQPFSGFPKDGLLSIFSVWGRVTQECSDPQTPDDCTERNQEDHSWTVVIHTPSFTRLERRSPPENLVLFSGSVIDPASMLALPHHCEEPAVAALRWSDELCEQFARMQNDYVALQRRRWRQHGSAMDSGHVLGGYAYFQQEYESEPVQKGLAMLLEICSDENTGMCWGDGGELTFYACPKALANGRFERIWGTCQCG